MANAIVIDRPSISVVIPCYNRQSTIARAVESAISQELAPLEVVVVDDGSLDRSAEVVRGLTGPVRLISQPNAGAASARNRGVLEAHGEWIAFVDSDDFWYPEHLSRIWAAIEQTEGRAPLYFSDLRQTPREDRVPIWTTAQFSIEREFELVEDATAWALLPFQPMMLQASVVRRSDYLAIGGLWAPLHTRHDTHFFLKLCFGRSACAVAGCGGEMTSDDESGQRLMTAGGPQTARYWNETVLLYRDLLRTSLDVSAGTRRELAQRLAVGHLRLAQYEMKGRRLLEAVRNVARASRYDPLRVLKGIARSAWFSKGTGT